LPWDAIRATPETRLICVTDVGDPGVRCQVDQLGGELLLIKPVVPEILLQAVRRPSPVPVRAGDGADCLAGGQPPEAPPGATFRVTTEDGQEFRPSALILTANEVRLIGSRSLLGQKVRVSIADNDGSTHDLSIRILWTFPADGGLVENGGVNLPPCGP